MTALPSDVPYGTVTWRGLAAVADTVADSDSFPDGVPVAGTVTFTPSAPVLLVAGATPPVTVFLEPIVVGVGSDGVLYDAHGNPFVRLPADSPQVSPTGWTWEVSHQLDGVERPSFSFHLDPSETVDLTLVAPVAESDGVPVTRGPKGDYGLVQRGTWNSTTTYVARDAVSYNGSSWVALVSSVGQAPTEGGLWTLLASKGDPGSISNLDSSTAALITSPSSTRTAMDARYLAPIRLVKLAAQSKSTATTSVDDTLVFSSVAAGLYSIEGVLFAKNAGTTGDIKLTLGGGLTASVPNSFVTFTGLPTTAAASGNPGSPYINTVNYSQASASFGLGNNAYWGISISGVIDVVVAGSLNLSWGQDVLDAANATTVGRGSWLQLTKIA